MDPSEKTTKLMAAINKCDVEFDLLEVTICKDEDLLARQALRALRQVVDILVSDLAYIRSPSQGGWLVFPGLATQLEARETRRQSEESIIG